MRSSRLCCLLSGIGLLASSVAAHATVYDFSYAFTDTANPSPETINGSFTGTGPITDIIDISNISMSLNGTQLTGPFYAWSYTPTSPNCGAASCYTFGGAVVDSTSAKSNFVFTTAVNSSELAASSYFYVI